MEQLIEKIVSSLPYIQIVISVLLIVVVLFQQSGSGAGGTFGGGGSISYTKRGIEKSLFNITIVLGVLFASIAFVQILL